MKRLTWTSLALALSATAPSSVVAQSVRAPYLQLVTETSARILWRTATVTDSVVCWGGEAASLTELADGERGTDHEVVIEGLEPGTRYFYAAGDGTACPVEGDPNDFFDTAPERGSREGFRMWVVGDSGTGSTPQIEVFEAMRATVVEDPELFLHVGDMAYGNGTTTEFDTRFFDIYADLLRHTPVWPAMGNHEGRSSSSATQEGPYFEAYSLPAGAEAGGLASGTEVYYSFDYANVHFVVLDSHQSSRAADGAMATWLTQDLAATDADWLIAYWHHPAYTKGSHDSDTENPLVEMRENILPILEAAGVDVVLAGHSHIYERSWLLHGAYATPSTAEGVIVDDGDGRIGGDGAYAANGDGALYVVAGHGGTGVSGDGDHPLMYYSEVRNGSCLIDVYGDALTLRNIRRDGRETDRVSLTRGNGIFLGSPLGGERFLAGSEIEVLWTSVGTSGEVRAEYTLDDGESWTSIADSLSDEGRLSWRSPRRESDEVRIRITDVNDRGLGGVSPGTFSLSAETERVVVPFGDEWEYLDDGSAPEANWTSEVGEWERGMAQLGYGDGDEVTVLEDADPNHPSVYFRQVVALGEDTVTAATLDVLYDDGIAVFVNGREVLNENIADATDHAAYASGGSGDNARSSAVLDPELFETGDNIIAAVVKQSGSGSSDLSFDLSLTVSLRVPLDPEPTDAGVVVTDGGTVEPVPDAGEAPDAGDSTEPAGGCGCRAMHAPGQTAFSLGAAALLALLLSRRRRV